MGFIAQALSVQENTEIFTSMGLVSVFTMFFIGLVSTVIVWNTNANETEARVSKKS